MDTVHWPQMKPMEEIVVQNSCSKPSSNSLERKARPPKESAINCPRCNSTNTKFCYYNNYSLSQPRYFCKTCRRYWTEGGSLRNVPVGGGSRKNKRTSSSSTTSCYSSSLTTNLSSVSSSISKKLPDLVGASQTILVSQNPRSMMHHEHGQDLNLGYNPTSSSDDFKTISDLIQVPNFDNMSNKNTTTTTCGSTSTSTHQLSALELLTGITNARSHVMNTFMPIPIPDHNSVYSSSSGDLNMIPMSEFKIPSLNFSLEYGMGGSGSIHHENSSGRLLFPFEDDLKTNTLSTTTAITTATATAAATGIDTATTSDHDGNHNVEQSSRDQNGDTNGFWSGMLGGGSW